MSVGCRKLLNRKGSFCGRLPTMSSVKGLTNEEGNLWTVVDVLPAGDSLLNVEELEGAEIGTGFEGRTVVDSSAGNDLGGAVSGGNGAVVGEPDRHFKFLSLTRDDFKEFGEFLGVILGRGSEGEHHDAAKSRFVHPVHLLLNDLGRHFGLMPEPKDPWHAFGGRSCELIGIERKIGKR